MENHSSENTESSKLSLILSLLSKGGLTILVVGVIMGTFMLAGIDRIVDQLELKSYDLRAQMQWGDSKNRPSSNVMILQFDDTSLNLLNDEFGLWPWPRDVHSRMIHFLNHVGTRALLYDIMFVANQKGNEKADESLIQAVRSAKNVYLSMNFDNDLAQNQKLGKDLTPHDLELLKPLAVNLKSELPLAPKTTTLKLQRDKSGSLFFDNDHMTFNHYRSILPGLLDMGRNIGIINHGTDEDGVSRSNPLVFRFQYHPFVRSQALPLQPKGNGWYDAHGQRVDAEGYLLKKSGAFPLVKQKDGSFLDQQEQPVDALGYLMDGYGHYQYQHVSKVEYLYFPYLGMRAALDLKYQEQKPDILLTREGHLQFKDYDIPLTNTGDFLVNWFNVNVKRESYVQDLQNIKADEDFRQAQNKALMEQAIALPLKSARRKELLGVMKQNQLEIQKNKGFVPLLENALNSKYVPQPYPMISAWEVIRTMKKVEAGQPLNAEDKLLEKNLKNKIIFIGATSVGAYDIKNTSIHSSMPGVVLQANLFDNLYQNKHKYMQRVSPIINLLATLCICLLAAGCTFRMRSPLAGLLTTANVAVLYVLFSVILYHTMSLWINVAMPMVCLIVTITITFMLKYFFRNKDYEKTYALATTDSMTGLYNHRFFQEHMRRSIDQANRFKHKFSLLLIDIDFFKKFNDTYGHQAGDEVLRQVAKKLKKNVRNVDVVARYGGEEMAIILDRANEEEALAVALKIVRAIADEAYPIAEGVAKHVTISCGVATFPSHGETPTQLIDFSDAGLYRAKENGRNQVGAQYDEHPSEAGELSIQSGEHPSNPSDDSHESDSHHVA